MFAFALLCVRNAILHTTSHSSIGANMVSAINENHKVSKRKILEDDSYYTKVFMTEKESERTPMKFDIRIHEDEDGYEDFKKCKEVGQIINNSFFSVYNCTEEDLNIDPNRKKALNQTLHNVASYIGNFLKVKHVDMSNFTNNTDSDFIIDVFYFSKPRENYFNFISHYPDFEDVIDQNNTLRFSSIIFSIDPKDFPITPQNFDSASPYFNQLLSVTLLSIVGSYNETWVDRSTGKRYPKEVMKEIPGNFQRHDYSPMYLCTPTVKKVIQKIFNRTTDANGNELCAAVASTYSLFTHDLFHFGDILNIFSDSLMYVSEISLAMLEDSGWYTVNWSYAKRLTWGARELLTEGEFRDFTALPFYKHLPYNYLFHSDGYLPSYDYKGYGNYKLSKYNKTADNYGLMKYGDFYIPDDNDEFFDNYIFEDTPIRLHFFSCAGDTWAIANSDRTNASCFESSFDANGSMIVNVDGQKFTCERKGQLIGEWVCPDPKYIKKIDDFLKLPANDYGHIPLYGDLLAAAEQVSNEKGLSGGVKAAIAVVAVIVVVGCVLLAWYCISEDSFKRTLCCKGSDYASAADAPVQV